MADDGTRRSRPRVGSTGARFPRRPDTDDAFRPPEPDPTAGDAANDTADDAGDNLVGRTGARFDSRARRARREAAVDAATPATGAHARGSRRGPAEPEPTDPGSDPDDGSAVPGPREAPTSPSVPVPSAPVPPVPAALDVVPTVWGPDVRPYVRTGGRTRARTDLALETLVSVPSPRPSLTDPEHRAIGEVCDGPRSVAEVAALVGVPLGVARVLIDDMAVAGLLVVHRSSSGASGAPDLTILERVLAGLHRL